MLKNRFILKHPYKLFDPHYHDFTVHDFESGEVLFRSTEKCKKVKTIKEMFDVSSHIVISNTNCEILIRIEKTFYLMFPFLRGGYKYKVFNDDNQILGVFKPQRFRDGWFYLKVYDFNGNVLLTVRKGLLGLKWSFFVRNERVAVFVRQWEGIRNYFKRKSDIYSLAIADSIYNNDLMVYFIISVIVACKHSVSIGR